MNRQVGRVAFAVAVLTLGTVFKCVSAATPAAQISLVDISQTTESFATAVPQVAVSRVDPNLVAVAWRKYGLPINTNAGAAPGERTADCHVAVSTDGGNTFTDTDLMPILRQHTDPELPTQPDPGLFYCNWSWVSIGDDRTIYAGGAMFTALGDIGWPGRPSAAPKQGRAMVTVSRDNGHTWSAPTLGIKVSRFAPGVTGLGCSTVLPCVSSPGGTDPWHTPWDNAMGVAAPGTPTFYSKTGNYVVASDDHAQNFGTIYTIKVPGWTFSSGNVDASGDHLVAPIIASASPLAATCPCLGVATSVDKGATWSAKLVAQSSAFNSSGTGDTARYPFVSIDPHAPSKYAVAAYTPDHTTVQVFYTEDDGKTWHNAVVGPAPIGAPIVRAGKVGLGYTTDGKILIAWRGFQAPDNPNVAGGPGPFDTFAALLQGSSFGPTIRVTAESSKYPTGTTVGSTAPNHADYNLNNGGGDFSTWITGNQDYAFVATVYAPGDRVLDTWLAKIPLTQMQSSPSTTVVGPIAAAAAPGDPSHNYPFLATTLFPAGSGYVEQEFFLQGTATRYSGICNSAGCIGDQTSFTNTPTVVSTGNPYKIRMIVRRPSDPAKFNGKVIVEWQNVTNNWELDVQWYRAAEYFIRNGYAWVGVGPQAAGINGTPNGLRAWNVSRYGSLDVTVGGTITDDSLKWDIFSQAGKAIASPGGVDPLGGLPGQRVLIATGDSQSSANLAAYINSVHQLDPIYPGFVLGGPLGIPIRGDAKTKVLKVASEYDVLYGGEARNRQPDSANLVTWEVAGASHSDYHNFVVNSPVRFRDVRVTGILPDTTNCVDPARSRTHLYLVYHAAYDAMARWITTGQRPPSVPERLIVNYSTNPLTAGRDRFGIAFGGIRLPDVTVPAAYNAGTNSGGKGGTSLASCQQAGTYVPFDDATLRSLYGTHENYVAQVRIWADTNVQQGFLLPEDADKLVADAQLSDVLRVPGADGSILVAEYTRTVSNQYVLVSDPAERASLERGESGGDWFRTGVTFTAWQSTGTAPSGTVAVCRLFGKPNVGPNEHVFSANGAECAALRNDPHWIDEDTPFRAFPVSIPVCPTGTNAVMRFWMPASSVLDVRHRYAVDATTIAAVRASGWQQEGPVFCAAP